MKILSKLDNTGMIEEAADKRFVTDAEKLTWNSKADKTYVDNKVKTNVPEGAKFTDTNTITTINGKTGAITKADITALGIPAQDTVYSHPSSHPASMITESSTKRFVSDSEKSTWNSKSDTNTKPARFVIGTSTAGWTAAECDYLCDGTADQIEINAAITALPATGGEVVILDGTYNITAKINVTKNNVSIRGNGNATILKRMFDSSTAEGVITLTSRSGCKIANLQVDGNNTSYTNLTDYGIYLFSSSNNTVTGNTCNNNRNGISLNASSINNTITGNTYNNNNSYSISLNSSRNNMVTGNTCHNNSGIYLFSSSNNTVTGNTSIRGTGLTTDYTTSQHTIQLGGTANNYNLISNNNCMGKAVTNGGGTGNTLVNNKFDAT